jgi:hypothetical protein
MVLSGFFLRYDAQVRSTAVETIVIEEDDLEALRCRQDRPVQILKPIFAIDLMVPHGIALPAISLTPVAPSMPRDILEVLVVYECLLALGQRNLLHNEPPCCDAVRLR